MSSRVLRTFAATVLAGALAASVASIGLGWRPSIATADPGDTFVALGSSQLIQSEDLSAIQVTLDTATVTLNRDEDFSACLGEGNPWTAVLPGAKKPFTAAWTSRKNKNVALYESVAQAETPAQAKAYAKTLLDSGIRGCQGSSSPWDFHYGKTSSSPVGSGTATWALSYRGSETRASGGAIVFSKGTNFGIIEVTGTWGPAGQTMESIAKVAVSRLA